MEHRCLSPWKGAVVGGVIVFIWQSASRLALPEFSALPLCMIGAFFWTWILGKIPGLTLKDAAQYGLFFGLAVGVLGRLAEGAWWFKALYVADAAAGWSLASLALSRCYASACAIPAK